MSVKESDNSCDLTLYCCTAVLSGQDVTTHWGQISTVLVKGGNQSIYIGQVFKKMEYMKNKNFVILR